MGASYPSRMTTYAQLNHLLDQVLSEVEAGRATEAVLMLSGMLDASSTSGQPLRCWRSALRAHPLSSLLSAQLNNFSGSANPEISRKAKFRTADRPLPSAYSDTLSDSFGRLGFVRGLHARRSLSAQILVEAWRAGRQVALIDCGEQGELDSIIGHDAQNIVVRHSRKTAREYLRAKHGDNLTIEADGEGQGAPSRRFDLILASDIADQCSTDRLTSWCRDFSRQLKPSGRLIISAFVPGHLGLGLQRICTNQDLICHAEFALEAVASASNLSITHFRDSSNSLIWAELRVAGEAQVSTGQAA